ncbi:MAG: hypothetical protein KAH30_00450, partial [Caldisericia bacterium]|nr:hypothetical protein [Caldisericia bacterium]
SDLKTIIDSNEGDSPVEITLSKSGKKVLLETEVPIKINSSSEVLGKIRDIVGTYQVELKQDSSF